MPAVIRGGRGCVPRMAWDKRRFSREKDEAPSTAAAYMDCGDVV